MEGDNDITISGYQAQKKEIINGKLFVFFLHWASLKLNLHTSRAGFSTSPLRLLPALIGFSAVAHLPGEISHFPFYPNPVQHLPTPCCWLWTSVSCRWSLLYSQRQRHSETQESCLRGGWLAMVGGLAKVCSLGFSVWDLGSCKSYYDVKKEENHYEKWHQEASE